MATAEMLQQLCDALMREGGLCMSIVDRGGRLSASAGDATVLDTAEATREAATELGSKDERCLEGSGLTVVAAGFITHMRLLPDGEHVLIAMFGKKKDVRGIAVTVDAAVDAGKQ